MPLVWALQVGGGQQERSQRWPVPRRYKVSAPWTCEDNLGSRRGAGDGQSPGDTKSQHPERARTTWGDWVWDQDLHWGHVLRVTKNTGLGPAPSKKVPRR